MRLERNLPVVGCPGDMFFDASALAVYVCAGDGWHQIETDRTQYHDDELAQTFFELAFHQPIPPTQQKDPTP